MSEYYTASSMNTGLQCPKLFNFKYIQLYRTKPTIHLYIGTALHAGLEQFFKGLPYQEAENAMFKSFEEYEYDEGIDEINRERLRAYLKGYYNCWELERTVGLKDKTVFVEQEFQFENQELEFRGKWDALVYDPETKTAIIYEHKTTGLNLESVTDPYFDKLPLDTQCTIYREAAFRWLNANGYPTGEMPRIIYDVIKKTKSSPKMKKRIVKRKTETEEEFADRKAEQMETIQEFGERMMETYMNTSPYFRHEIPFVFSDHKRRLIELEEYARLLGNKGFLEIRNSTACGNYGGCAFMNVCLGRERLDDSTTLIKQEEKHPELDGKGNTVVNL